MIVFHDLNETSTFPSGKSQAMSPTSSHFVIFASRSRPYEVSLASPWKVSGFNHLG